MPIITFWSNNQKAIGQTVSASVAATVMAMERNYKILLVSADINNSVMEEAFGSQHSNAQLLKTIVASPKMNLETGIEGLFKIAQGNRITPEAIRDYTKIIYKNRLEILYSSTNTEMSVPEQFDCLKKVILNAGQYYDYVFVDLKKGIEYQQILDILDVSDVIVLNTEQGTKTLEEFFKLDVTQKYIQGNKILWNICKYDKKSKYNVKNLIRTIWKKQNIYNIPYNTLLYEAAKEGGIAELLLRIRTMRTDDENGELLKQVKELIEGISMKYQELQMRL